MRRRNWNLIFPIAIAAGYAAAGIWGAFIGPLAALAAYAFIDRRASRSVRNEEERFAAFVNAARAEVAPRASEIPEPEALPALQNVAPGLSREALASKSIALAVRAADLPLAIGLYAEFADLRRLLTLDAAAWHRLGLALLEQKAYLDAAWALHESAMLSGDRLAAEKRLAEVAGKALAAGAPEVARQLYLELVDRYPDAGLASFARARADDLKSRTAAAQ